MHGYLDLYAIVNLCYDNIPRNPVKLQKFWLKAFLHFFSQTGTVKFQELYIQPTKSEKPGLNLLIFWLNDSGTALKV